MVTSRSSYSIPTLKDSTDVGKQSGTDLSNIWDNEEFLVASSNSSAPNSQESARDIEENIEVRKGGRRAKPNALQSYHNFEAFKRQQQKQTMTSKMPQNADQELEVIENNVGRSENVGNGSPNLRSFQ